MTEGQKYKVMYEPRAWRELLKLPDSAQDEVQALVESLEINPRPSGCKKMEDNSGYYRVRAGNYRVVYDIEDQEIIVIVLRIGDRKEIYRKRK